MAPYISVCVRSFGQIKKPNILPSEILNNYLGVRSRAARKNKLEVHIYIVK